MQCVVCRYYNNSFIFLFEFVVRMIFIVKITIKTFKNKHTQTRKNITIFIEEGEW
jgi:hypothetical protein